MDKGPSLISIDNVTKVYRMGSVFMAGPSP